MSSPPTWHDDFAELYAGCHVELLRYVLTLLPDRPTAEDVVQETARVLWRKFDQDHRSRPFWPWARGFAHLEVLKARRRLAASERRRVRALQHEHLEPGLAVAQQHHRRRRPHRHLARPRSIHRERP